MWRRTVKAASARAARFDQNAVDRLAEVGHLWRDRAPAPRLAASQPILTPNLASMRPSYASSSADTSGPDLANDDKPGTYWQSDDGQTSGSIEIDLRKATSFNTIAVLEPTYLGDYGAESRVASYG